MNRNRIWGEEDGKILADPEIATILACKRRNSSLSPIEVKKLVQALRPGMARQANLEKYAGGWRLRFFFYTASGDKRRRSIVIGDAATMEWVRNFLIEARRKRREYRVGLTLRDLGDHLENLRTGMGGLLSARLREAIASGSR